MNNTYLLALSIICWANNVGQNNAYYSNEIIINIIIVV